MPHFMVVNPAGSSMSIKKSTSMVIPIRRNCTCACEPKTIMSASWFNLSGTGGMPAKAVQIGATIVEGVRLAVMFACLALVGVVMFVAIICLAIGGTIVGAWDALMFKLSYRFGHCGAWLGGFRAKQAESASTPSKSSHIAFVPPPKYAVADAEKTADQATSDRSPG